MSTHKLARADASARDTGEVRLIASRTTWMETSAIDQLRKTAALPGMTLAVGLPDLHPGKVSPVGAAFVSEGWVYPTLVGNDIGCGIGLWRTELTGAELKPAKWADRLRGLDEAWEGDAEAWLAAREAAPTGFEASLGTVGSGNHFAELQRIEKIEDAAACEALGVARDGIYLCVHSGSRGFGEAVLRSHTETRGADGLFAPTGEADAYLARHAHAVRWAAANRALVAARVLACLKAAGRPVLDVCHNAVVRQPDGAWLHRKGAAPADAGPVVIPGSRGAFSYLVLPHAEAATHKSAASLAHGAGRKWSRTDSRGRLEKRYTAKDLERTALGSHVICEDRQLLYEEAPQAYKDVTAVIADLVDAGLCRVLAILRPVVTYKVRR